MAEEDENNSGSKISQFETSPRQGLLPESLSCVVANGMLNISSFVDGNRKYQHRPVTSDDGDDDEESNEILQNDNIYNIPCAVSSSPTSTDEKDTCKENGGMTGELSLSGRLNGLIQSSTEYIDEQLRPMRGYRAVKLPRDKQVKNQSLTVDSAIDDNPPDSCRFDSELDDLYETLRLRRDYSIGDYADPKIIQTLLNIGQIHFEQKEYPRSKSVFLEAFEKLPQCTKRTQAEKDRMLEKMATDLYEFSLTFIDKKDTNAAARSLGQALDCYHLAGLQDSEYYRLATKALGDCGTNYDQDYDDVII